MMQAHATSFYVGLLIILRQTWLTRRELRHPGHLTESKSILIISKKAFKLMKKNKKIYEDLYKKISEYISQLN